MQPPVQKNQVVQLEIEDLAYGGMGLAKREGYVIFVRGAVPGDFVKARITKRQANHSQAAIEEILRPSPLRIEPRCRSHNQCGGCSWQNIPYEEQLKAKRRHVAEALQHIGGQAESLVEPVEPSPREWRYRNKMDYTFGSGEDGLPLIGFHAPGRFDEILPVRECLLQPEIFDGVLQAVEQWARAGGLASYNPRNHRGVLRSLVLRYSESDGGWLAALITTSIEIGRRVEELAEVLNAAAPNFRGLLWGFHDGVADIVCVDREAGRSGPLFLEEQIDECRFRISPLSFFQTNTLAAALLYRCVRECASLTGDEVLLDAYCGTGTIGIFCASLARTVYGIEVVLDAVRDARHNAAVNGYTNCVFVAAPLAQGLGVVQNAAGPWINRVIIDPPRGGMDKASLRQLLALKAPGFVYVSCNPATLSRDVKTICESGYRIARVKPFDLFPQTYHVETVIRFER